MTCSDFTLYYLDRLTKKSNLISRDADLQQAFLSSSRPFLDISLNVIDYGNALANLTGEWQLSKNINKYRNILSEWDVVTNSDIILAQTINKTNNFIFKQVSFLVFLVCISMPIVDFTLRLSLKS